jgi:hypothetical protein
MKAVMHHLSSNHLINITFHHDKISKEGSYEHVNGGQTDIEQERHNTTN